MTETSGSYLSADDILTAIPRLTPEVWTELHRAGLVLPGGEAGEAVYAPADLARIALLCDLVQDFDLMGEALMVVMALIDDLHASHQRFLSVVRAVEGEPVEVRQRIGLRLIAVDPA